MLRTAECVSPLHVDKICDRISDAVLDEALKQDPESRVAIETMGGHGIVTVTGEMTTKAFVDVREIVRKIAGDKVGIQVNIVKQSPEIQQGVDVGGAGDQGIMVGYACSENKAMMPQELFLARSLCRFLYAGYEEDGKTQVTMNGNEIETVVASWSNVSSTIIENLIHKWIQDVSPKNKKVKIYANPAGDWQCCGFDADTGLTGRKLAVDNYGPAIPIGGGAFSGKDPTKVDRSAAYMARYLAVKTLKKFYKPEDNAEVLVKIAYAIGVPEPVMVTIQGRKFGEENWTVIDTENIASLEQLTPKAIIEFLDLKRPRFEDCAAFGHFGVGEKWDIISDEQN